jgi:hypothetical protein
LALFPALRAVTPSGWSDDASLSFLHRPGITCPLFSVSRLPPEV